MIIEALTDGSGHPNRWPCRMAILGQSEARRLAPEIAPSHVLTIKSAATRYFGPTGIPEDRHLIVVFEDTIDPDHEECPGPEHLTDPAWTAGARSLDCRGTWPAGAPGAATAGRSAVASHSSCRQSQQADRPHVGRQARSRWRARADLPELPLRGLARPGTRVEAACKKDEADSGAIAIQGLLISDHADSRRTRAQRSCQPCAGARPVHAWRSCCDGRFYS